MELFFTTPPLVVDAVVFGVCLVGHDVAIFCRTGVADFVVEEEWDVDADVGDDSASILARVVLASVSSSDKVLSDEEEEGGEAVAVVVVVVSVLDNSDARLWNGATLSMCVDKRRPVTSS